MEPEALLTQDELDFIKKMQHNPQFNLGDASPSLTVNGGLQVKDLLTRLAAHEQVTIQAQFENQQMSFPLELVEDEFHAVHLHLGAPSIYEDGPMVRPWRLTLASPVALRDDLGLSTDFLVREISFKGVLLELDPETPPPVEFSLWFCPDGHAPMALNGTLERTKAKGLAAYRLSQSDAGETERLRQYILQQHQLSHPDLHV
ncbi:hypothetical protein SFA35_04880 [Pseudomonas sp. HR96]|uniref:hypothetical protein n=1 Tax=Pseudomonas sp. HR96 TaxID=1027966 RepID=UPI002A7591ED|nr:hypothetical protein [Pseudomonas sp. HR96]WPP00713.1 hypothetical protein SFA35_04880 [Pseudomonas sp. HR96]